MLRQTPFPSSPPRRWLAVLATGAAVWAPVSVVLGQDAPLSISEFTEILEARGEVSP